MKKIFNIIIENGIIISLFLGLAYLLTFQYQKGKITYYGIPTNYIDLSLGSVIETCFTILLILYFSYIFLNTITTSPFEYKSHTGKNNILASVLCALFLAILFGVFKKVNILFGIVIGIYLLYLLCNNLAPIFLVKEKLSYFQKIKIYSEKKEKELEEKAKKEKPLLNRIFEKPTKILFFACCIIFMCSVFNLSGAEDAKNATTFYVANDYNDKIIVHSTTDYYVLMELENNKLLDTYQIVPSNEIGTITMKEIGPLLITDIKDRNNKTLADLYVSTKNDDKTYSYKFYDLNNNILFQKENIFREPKINQINATVYELKTQTGTGLSTNWAVYCDVDTSKVSETFNYVLGVQDDYVVCADYEEGKHFITIQNIFDKAVYYKTYKLENISPVAADFALGCEFDSDNKVTITYLTGEDYTESKLTIDIQ